MSAKPIEHYRSILSAHRLPICVECTKPELTSKKSFRDITHNYWKVRWADDGRVPNPFFWLSIDSVVDRGGIRLSDPGRLDDLLMKKLILLDQLESTRLPGRDHVNSVSRHFDWQVRWRLSIGFDDNGMIDRHHFDHLCDLVRRADPLVPIFERLDWFWKRVEDELVDLAILYRDGDNVHNRLQWDVLASEIGTTSSVLSRNPAFVSEMLDRISSSNSPVAAQLVQALRTNNQAYAQPNQYAQQTIRNIFRPWHVIWDISKSAKIQQNALVFDPFEKKSLRKLARELSSKKPPGRTKTLYPEDFIRLMSSAANWAFENGEYIIAAVGLLRDRKWGSYPQRERKLLEEYMDAIRPAGAPALFMGWHSTFKITGDRKARLDVGTALKLLMTACGILIGGLGARRSNEIGALRTKCVQFERGNYRLTSYISKTVKDLDDIPVPRLVAEAVSLMEKINAQVGETTPWLFQVRKNTGFVEFNLTANMKEFVDYLELEPPEGSESWEIAAHQLRRGFALLYFYGYELHDLDSLSHFLRHFDPEMTRIYVTEIVAGAITSLRDEMRARIEVGRANLDAETLAWIETAKKQLAEMEDLVAEFEDVAMGVYAHRVLSLHKGTDTAIGKGSRRLYSDVHAIAELAAADVRIGSAANDNEAFEEAFIVRAKQQAFNRFLRPVPGGVAHCTADPSNEDDVATAECAKAAEHSAEPWSDIQRPACINFAFSGAYPCLGCDHGAALNHNQKIVERKLDGMEESIHSAPTSGSKDSRQVAFEALRSQYIEAQKHGRRHSA
ncbi:tyrosine-type recombinase/integrase [Rhizobium leguminosarum]|uniref:tyrosine-type recombinase/integrase n=1 Tax=Rhizobium leguminosarum TaxID=384 RepID=UPI00036F7D06|nr:tyrosine-type recombinase/integrase [Rhizobium leguminosarum]